MNFLDLSTASEEERRLIKEILSDTSVINIAEPPTYKHHNKQSSHNHHNQQQQHHHHHNNHQQQQQAQQANHNHQPTPHQQHNHQPQQHHPQSQLQHPQKQQHHKFPAHPQPVQNGVVPRDYTTSSSSISTPPLQASPSTTNTATTTPTIPNSTSNVSPLPQPMLPPNLAGQGAAPTNANNVATNHGANNNSQNNIYMTSTQAPPPTGYAIPPPPTHVTAFGPPQLPHPHHSHHVYSGPPLFQPNYYVMYSVPPSCMPYVIPQNTVVSQQTARQQQHLQQEQQQPQPQQSSGSHQINTTNNNRPQNVNSTNSTISSSSNMHPRYRYSAHNHNQQQSHQNLSQRQPRHQQHQNNHQLDLRQQSHHQNHQTQSQPQNQLATHPQLNQKSSLPDDVPAEQVVHLKTQAQHVAISNRQDEITLPKEEESTQLGQIKQDESEITENSSKEDVDYEMKANNHEQSNSEQLKTKDDSQLSQTEVKVPNSNNSSVTSQSEAASASSKSWASLFRAGAGTELVVNGNSEHNNKSESENNSDDEVLKTKSSASPPNSKSSKSHSKSYSNEQRFQEAAKRASDKMAMRFAQRIKTMNLKHSLPFIKPRGFINKGNGCYINATLQALIACPPFYNLMKEIGDLRGFRRDNSCTPILDSFAELFLNFPPLDITKKNKQMNSQDQKPTNIETLQAEAIEPRCIYNVLGLIKSECLRGAQEDAEEFLSSVLNGLHEEMIGLGEILDTKNDPTNQNGNVTDAEESVDDVNNDDNLWREVGPKNRSLPIRTAKMVNTPIQEIFGGSLFSIRTAGKDRCGYRSPFFDLQLDISGDNVKSVQDAIKSFTATEIIHDFYCSKTKQKLDAQRRTSLDQLPPILILHLKQFFYSQDHGLKKLVKKIEYPIDFELPDSCLHEKNSNDKNPWTSRSYKLLAVVYHDGKEAIKGHYLTDVYHIGSSQWIRCDDGNLKVISSPRIDNPESLRTPYLLFYRRLNTLRVQSGNPDSKKQKN